MPAPESNTPTAASSAGPLAAKLGALGFGLGFFGPMILDPSSGNGPMLGIFITGPAGLVLGALYGLLSDWRARRRSNTTPP